jgi:flagellar basal-body rod protein FlgB
MPISDIPIFTMLRTRMQWHQERQRVLAENVANADSPKFQPRDLTPLKFESAQPAARPLTLAATNAAHLTNATDATQFAAQRAAGFETLPSGNGVSLEDEMIKVADNQTQFQTAAALYARGLDLLKVALGKR